MFRANTNSSAGRASPLHTCCGRGIIWQLSSFSFRCTGTRETHTAARLVCHAMKADHIAPVLKDLHWLSRKGSSTSYVSLRSSVNIVWHHVARMEPGQRPKSSSSQALVVPATRRSSLGDRAFLVAAAKAWNSLPSTVTAASTLHSFRRALKTHLFTASVPPS